MTEQDKQLLLADLCMRLPYGVKVRINTKTKYYTAIVCEITRNYICVEGGGEICFSHGTYKPYLRPMSSMTEEEKAGYNLAADRDLDRMAKKVGRKLQGDEKLDETLTPYYEHIDWLNSHHFDYRGLISMGLALEAPEDMCDTKTE